MEYRTGKEVKEEEEGKKKRRGSYVRDQRGWKSVVHGTGPRNVLEKDL